MAPGKKEDTARSVRNQAELLEKSLEAMDDGGTIEVSQREMSILIRSIIREEMSAAIDKLQPQFKQCKWT